MTTDVNEKLAAAFRRRKRQQAQANAVAARERAEMERGRRESEAKREAERRKRQQAQANAVAARERAEMERGRRESASKREGRKVAFVREEINPPRNVFNPDQKPIRTTGTVSVRRAAATTSTAAPTKQETKREREQRLVREGLKAVPEIGLAASSGGRGGKAPRRSEVARQKQIDTKRAQRAAGLKPGQFPQGDFRPTGGPKRPSSPQVGAPTKRDTGATVQRVRESVRRSEERRKRVEATKKRLQAQEDRNAASSGRKPRTVSSAEARRVQSRSRPTPTGAGATDRAGGGVKVQTKKPAVKVQTKAPAKQPRQQTRAERRKEKIAEQRKQRTERRAQARQQLAQNRANQSQVKKQIAQERKRLERAKQRSDKKAQDRAAARLKSLEQGQRNLSKREIALRAAAAGAVTAPIVAPAAASVFAPKGGEESSTASGSDRDTDVERSRPNLRGQGQPTRIEQADQGEATDATDAVAKPGETPGPSGAIGPTPGRGRELVRQPKPGLTFETGQEPAPDEDQQQDTPADQDQATGDGSGGDDDSTTPPPGGQGDSSGGGPQDETTRRDSSQASTQQRPGPKPRRRVRVTLPASGRRRETLKPGTVPTEVTYRSGQVERAVNLRTGDVKVGRDLSPDVPNNPTLSPSETLRVTKTARKLPGEPSSRRVRLFGARGGEVVSATVTPRTITFTSAGRGGGRRRGTGQPRRRGRRRRG